LGAVGLAVTSWYDHKKLDRISTNLLRYVDVPSTTLRSASPLSRAAAEPG
jgi:hypothetical protein